MNKGMYSSIILILNIGIYPLIIVIVNIEKRNILFDNIVILNIE